MKKAFIISFVLLFPITASAYSLLQPEAPEIRPERASYFVFVKEPSTEQPSRRPSENAEPVESMSQATSHTSKLSKPVSPVSAFFLALIPIPSSALAFYLVDRSAGKPAYEYISLSYAIFSAAFFTIPAHIYVHDGLFKTLIIILAKGIFSLTWEYALFTEMGCALSDDNSKACELRIGEPAIAIGLFGFLGLYAYELIDAPLAANRYNEKIKQQQKAFNLIPYATRDRAGLAFQVSF